MSWRRHHRCVSVSAEEQDNIGFYFFLFHIVALKRQFHIVKKINYLRSLYVISWRLT